MKKNQKGFGVIEELLMLVLVGLISFTGWYVWHSKQTTNKNLDAAASDSSATAQPQVVNKSTQSTSDSMTIIQWGVKVGLRDTDSLEYSYTSQPNGSYYDASYDSSVTFNLTASQSVPKDCSREIGTLLRSTEEPKAKDINGQPSIGAVKKVGIYYYFEAGGSLSCSADVEHNALLDRVKQDLVDIQPSA